MINNKIKIFKDTEKPCWKLKWCPYGSLVEIFPLHKIHKKYAQENNLWCKMVVGKGWVECNKDDPEAMEDLNRAHIECMEKGIIDKYSCKTFGHDCPVFYLRENIIEI